MIALLHFEDKVHRKGLVRAEGLQLLMPRLLSQVLEHLGFSVEPASRGGSDALGSCLWSDP